MAHELTLTERVEATSTTAGKEAYYTCENCGRYFEDAAGPVEIANLDEYGVIPATGVTVGGKQAADTNAAQTGDDSNISLWIVVMLAAGAALTGTAPLRQKEKLRQVIRNNASCGMSNRVIERGWPHRKLSMRPAS